jgi:hydrogenase/urease accessory protein HupE
MRGLRRCFWAALWALATLAGPAAQAHEISMAEMQLRETSRGEFLWQWTAGLRSGDDLRPLWPEPCREDAEGAGVLRCGPGGLSGRLGMDGVGKRFSAVLVKVYWLDGQSSVHTLTQGQPEVQLFGTADDRRNLGEIASAYAVLGVEHILAGIDHLLFVIALLFLVGFQRRLVWTITAFTVAHSVTLALSALGLLTLRPPPVEATIALSILLVAGEALHQRPTLSRRWPALVAFLFGLVHGLGFAGALEQIGLPQNHVPMALLSFNLGVEAGQMVVVLLAWALCAVLSRWPLAQRARRPLLYGIGGMAAYWTIGRVASLFA